jgi:hypothetical protein
MKTWLTAIAAYAAVSILFFAGNASAEPFPDTGQTKCYNNTVEIPCPHPGEDFYGQDAQYQGPVRSYAKLGYGGAVLSNSTGPAKGDSMPRKVIK